MDFGLSEEQLMLQETVRTFAANECPTTRLRELVDAGTGQVIGSSRYNGYDEQNSEVEIGWSFLARSHWGGVYNRPLQGMIPYVQPPRTQ